MSSPKAAIIAGGLGTRIRSISGDMMPKALVPVNGEPIIALQLDLLARYGVKEIAVLCGHLADALIAGMTSLCEKRGLKVEFFVEREPLGTAGNFASAREFLSGGDFFVVYGDVAVEMDLTRLMDFHRRNNAVGTIVCHPNDHPHESDLLVLDGAKVKEIVYKKSKTKQFYRNFVPAAVYALSSKAFDFIEPAVKQDFIKDVFPKMLAANASLYAYNTTEYLKDMGTVERYQMVEDDLKSGRLARYNFSVKKPCVFFDRDGVLNPDEGDEGVFTADKLELYAGAAQAVKLVNDAGMLAVLATNQPHIAKGFMTFADLDEINAKLETLLGYERAKLDGIYFCPHHQHKGFAGEIPELKIDCDCRKPKAGMLLKAASELPIDLTRSCMIGDSWRDFGAARNAGVYAYGVRTGCGSKKIEQGFRPDLVFANLTDAVNYIVHGVPKADEIVNKCESVIKSSNAPFIIGVSGFSRGGKSVFAHSLFKGFKARGLNPILIRLDDFICPKSKRTPQMTARERNNVPAYGQIIDRLMSGDEVETAGYDAATREENVKFSYKLNGENVIILDGMFACDESVRMKLSLSIFVEAPKQTLIVRFKEFYAWKGLTEPEIDELLAARMNEEWLEVAAQKYSSDVAITTTD